jgi:hypothetical protein
LAQRLRAVVVFVGAIAFQHTNTIAASLFL